jgi:glycosyltransferase involved in cell wall biosynthesis
MIAPSTRQSDRALLPQPSRRPLRSFLFVNDLIPRQFGAGAKFIAELGRRASATGIRMGILLAGEPIPAVADVWHRSGIVWWSIPDWKPAPDKERRWRFISGFRRVMALEPWDAVAFHHCNPLSVISACALARIYDGRRFASVWHQHQGVPSPRGVKRYISTLRLLGPFMNALVVNSDFGIKYYKERRCAPDKIRVVHLGVPTHVSSSPACVRSKLGLPDSARCLVSVVSLIRRKGVDVLLHAVRPLLREHSQWHLLVVGGGPLLGDLQELARQLQIDQQTHFLGISNDVMEILRECDAFVLPSRNEDHPCAILEAMASSLPVVATNVGAVQELVIHDETGLLVPPEDTVALRAALEAIMLDEVRAGDFGRRGRERTATTFSFDRTVEEYLDLFRELCR